MISRKVGEMQPAGHIADSIDPPVRGFETGIDLDTGRRRFNPGGIKVQFAGVCLSARLNFGSDLESGDQTFSSFMFAMIATAKLFATIAKRMKNLVGS